MKKLITMLFVMFALCLTACNGDDKDNDTQAENPVCDPACTEDKECKCAEDKCECVEVTSAPTCDPACNTETEDCVCAEGKCECKAKEPAPEECFCDDAKTVACPEGGKDACPADPSATEDICKDKTENDDCGENKTCQKSEGDKLECKDKPTDPAPADPDKQE